MSTCSCTSSRTGNLKVRYATRSQAELACNESRRAYVDGDTLNAYYCSEGDCWHVGNSLGFDDFDSQGEAKQEPSQGAWHLSDKYPQTTTRKPSLLVPQKQSCLPKTAGTGGSFLKKLMDDAQPRADNVKRIANRVYHSQAVQSCGKIVYKGLVRTVGIGLVLSEPVSRVTKKLASSIWKAIEKAAETK